jgi:hypothetical protein
MANPSEKKTERRSSSIERRTCAAKESPFRSRRIQAIAGVAALVLIAVVLFMTRREASNVASLRSGPATEGENAFALPQASRDFVGAWYGVLKATLRNPSNFGTESHDFATGFILVDGRVVMKMSLWAPPGAKITRVSATGVDSKHVRIEYDMSSKDTLGEPLWMRDRYDIMLSSRDELDSAQTQTYYRDSAFARPVATVKYRGPLRRMSDAEAQSHAKKLQREGFQKQAETEAAMPR